MGLYIIAVCVIALAAGGFGIYFKVRSGIRRFSRAAFGTDDLMQGIEQEKLELEDTPKSLSSTETMSSGRIAADFPELSLEDMKNRAAADITDILEAVESGNVSRFEKIQNVATFIDEQRDSAGGSINFNDIIIHNTVLNRYLKQNGSAVIRFQTALQYILTKGTNPPHKVQDRFELDYSYNLDETKLQDGVSTFLKCPNCGAPVKTLGVKYCEYCGSEIIAKIQKLWELDAVRRV